LIPVILLTRSITLSGTSAADDSEQAAKIM